MSQIKKTALVILNYNGKNHLEKFLPSIVEHTTADIEIIVGDNASTDDSISFIRSYYPQIKISILSSNLGFAEGYNRVLQLIEADYYFLLNSDVELRHDWSPMISYLEDHTDVIAVQPKILSYHQPDYFEHAGGAGGWIDALGYPFCMGRILDRFEKDEGQYDTPREIFWSSGAAMLVRAKEFHQIGGFDSDYFAHMEEIDWCWRAKKCGWKMYSFPSVKVYHVGGGTLPYHSERKVFLNFRNNLATLIKNQSIGKLIWLLPVRFGLDALASLQFLFKGNSKSCNAIIKAYGNILTWWPSLMKKRKAITFQSKDKIFQKVGIYNGSILLNYFLFNKKKFSELIKI